MITKQYKSKLSLLDTEIAIQLLKGEFQRVLSHNLNLQRVSAPIFLERETGLNDNLNGEAPVTFVTKSDQTCEIVHSLAKWKRYALGKYKFQKNTGLYTDMNALRIAEDLSNIHSYYVDQWDWELIIERENRNIDFLKEIVEKIFDAFKKTEVFINLKFPVLKKKLPENIFFITSQELERLYPKLTPVESEHAIAKEKIAVFIIGIGHKLESGNVHDKRAPDYDDWHLNGDLIFYSDILERSVEMLSMGIRVDKESLKAQAMILKKEDILNHEFHKNVIAEELPFTIGGGIGQSRLSMFLLDKKHIGEVQVSVWPEKVLAEMKKQNIFLL